MMLKKIIRLLIQLIIQLNETFISCIKVLIYSKLSLEVKKFKAENYTKCYILGNGPSLKENLLNDLDFLQKQELFVVNDFAKSEYYEIVKPKYYVFADPCYWDIRVYKKFYEESQAILHAICDKTEWPLHIFIPNQAYKTKVFQSIFNQKNNIKIYNYNTTSIVNGFERLNYFFYKNFLGMPPSQNVLISCIYLSINMKFTEVNILGADHSWTQDLIVNEKNEVCHTHVHFYDNGKLNYFPFRNIYGEFYKMHQILRDYAQMFEGYHILKYYSDQMNVKVYNRCQNSFIEAFERKPIKA